jgi:hypothetical protein
MVDATEGQPDGVVKIVVSAAIGPLEQVVVCEPIDGKRQAATDTRKVSYHRFQCYV